MVMLGMLMMMSPITGCAIRRGHDGYDDDNGASLGDGEDRRGRW